MRKIIDIDEIEINQMVTYNIRLDYKIPEEFYRIGMITIKISTHDIDTEHLGIQWYDANYELCVFHRSFSDEFKNEKFSIYQMNMDLEQLNLYLDLFVLFK